MSNRTGFDTGGVGCGTVLLIVFVVLKLTGNIDWTWFWVLSPIWIPIVFVIFCLTLAGLLYLLGITIDGIHRMFKK